MKTSLGRACRRFVAGGVVTAVIALGCACPASADWLGDERRLTTGAATHDGPQLSGTRLAYADHTAERVVSEGAGTETLFDVRVLDLATGADVSLTPTHSALGLPAISGNAVVWSDYGTGADRGLKYHDLRTGQQRRLEASPGSQPQLSGARLCYEFQGRIHVYHLTTDRDLVVSPAGSSASACDISGGVVVWQDRRGGHDSDIYAYDLATRSETRLTTSHTDQSLPRIDDGLVVWQDEVSATNFDIYAYDVTTGSQTRVTDDESTQWFADVADGRIVWMDERNGHDNTEIYAHDAASGVTTRVTEHDGWSGNPTVAGDWIAYEDGRGDGHNLYLRRVTPPQLSLGPAADSARTDLAADSQVTGPAADSPGTDPLVSGHLLGADGRPVADETVVLQRSTDGEHWSQADTAVTGQRGTFAFAVDARSGDVRVRVHFAGSPEYPPATSSAVSVERTGLGPGLRVALP